MPLLEHDIAGLANGFPPGLNTADPPTEIKPNECAADSYGFSLTRDGRLAKGTISAGTARIAKTVTISSVDYLWHYNRLWRANANVLEYYAQFYNDSLAPQRNGEIYFDDLTHDIVQIIPFGPDSMCVVKPGGSYILSNLSDSRAFFQRSDIIQELAASTSTHVVELDGVIYAANTSGVFAYFNGATTEITRKVRDDLAAFRSFALVASYEKKYIIGGSTMVYEVPTKKLFRYNSTNFQYTSRQFRLPDWAVFDASRLFFKLERGDTNAGFLEYQVKLEDRDWTPATRLEIPYLPKFYTSVPLDLSGRNAVSKFQLRLTDLSSNIYLKEIRMDLTQQTIDSYRL